MTTKEWLEKVGEVQEVLRDFVVSWYPFASRSSHHTTPMTITAPRAEQACQAIREEIAQREKENPVERWDRAVSRGDADTLMSLLNGAWFGVPESASCWLVPGFREAVDLLDDLPREELRESPHSLDCTCGPCVDKNAFEKELFESSELDV